MTTSKFDDGRSSSKILSLSSALLKGTGWTIAIRWASKFLGIISLGICARVLFPADYGLVNMAMVVVGFSQVLVEFGLDASLIRNQNATRAHYNTAWSLKILQSTAIAIIVLVAAPIAARVFKDERILPIMVAVGLAGLVGGFQNIYVVNLRKHLDFRKDFLFSFIPRFISFCVSVTTVLLLKSYWGLVIGICSAEIARMVVSYWVVRDRASWSLSHWRELTGFSIWYFLDGFAQFCSFQLDRFVIGVLGGAGQVGLYGVGREVAALPSTELVLPIGRALMPVLAKLNDAPERQTAAIKKALGGVMLLAVPIAVGFALVAREFILLLFGDKWIESVPLVAILSLAAVTSGFRSTAQNVLLVVGKVRMNAMLSWAYAALVLGLLYPAYQLGGTVGIAWLYSIVGGVAMLAYGAYLYRLKLLRGWSLWLDILRSFIAAAAMYLLVTVSASLMPDALMLSLAIKTVMGASVYSIVVLALWVAMGRPDSSERVILSLLNKKIQSLGMRLAPKTRQENTHD